MTTKLATALSGNNDTTREIERMGKAFNEGRALPYTDNAVNKLLDFRYKTVNDYADPDQNVYKHFGCFLHDIVVTASNPANRSGSVADRMNGYGKQLTEQNEKQAATFFTKDKSFPSGYNETVLGDGGALIPPQFIHEILMRTYDHDLLSQVRLFNQISSNIIKIPAVNESSRANGSRFGGVTSYWTQEAASQTESKGQFQTIDLKINKVTVACRMTDEQFEDSGFTLDSWLTPIVSEEFKFKLGDALVNGDGVDKPQGLLFTAGPKVAQAKETGQAVATITTGNLYDMWGRLWLGCKKNAVWLGHSSVVPQLLRLTQGNFPVFLSKNSIVGGVADMLLGRPFIETEFNQTLGTEGDLILTDLSQILMASKGNMRSFASMHVYFNTGEQAFRFQMRVDMKNWWKTALTQFKGTTTVSSVVTLSTRA